MVLTTASQGDFAFDDLYSVTPYPDICDFVSSPARADKDLAGTLDFYALLDVNRLFGLCYSVPHQPCRCASGR